MESLIGLTLILSCGLACSDELSELREKAEPHYASAYLFADYSEVCLSHLKNKDIKKIERYCSRAKKGYIDSAMSEAAQAILDSPRSLTDEYLKDSEMIGFVINWMAGKNNMQPLMVLTETLKE